MFAAVEIYNKPKVEYREQTVAFLLVNAWEVLIKAQIIQQNGGKIQSIYRRKRDSRKYECWDGDVVTIDIWDALNQSGLPEEVKRNIRGLIKVRNQATHLGVLAPELKQSILEFSTASVQNFVKTFSNWFAESIDAPYLLPLGFVGIAQTTVTTSVQQKNLLIELAQLAKSHSSDESAYSVVMQVKVQLSRGLSGGGNIGLTNDPNVPKVSITDDEALKTFPTSYNGLVAIFRERYPNFKKNNTFNVVMNTVNDDPKCAYLRKLDPTSDKTPKKRFYNKEQSLAKLDNAYAGDKQT